MVFNEEYKKKSHNYFIASTNDISTLKIILVVLYMTISDFDALVNFGKHKHNGKEHLKHERMIPWRAQYSLKYEKG